MTDYNYLLSKSRFFNKEIKISTVNVFGRTFKAVDWHLIPGNNGIINPWDDEASIREKLWNSFVPEQVVIDVGAQFGLYTLPALMQGCIVHSFEPNIKQFNIMTESVNMNDNFSSRYFGYNFGLWNDSIYPKELKCNEITFATMSLDKIIKNFDRVDIIKIDVEGAELGVLEGTQETIKKLRPSFLIEDHTGIYDYCILHNTGKKIISMLESFNYVVDVGMYIEPPPKGRYFFIATPK